MSSCEDAQFTLSTDSDGRAWEHFWLGQRYQFSNQIPNLKSFTTTEPGWVIADRGLCAWWGQPPARMATTTTTTTAQAVALPPSPAAANSLAATGSDGAVGLLLVLGLGAAAVWAWFNKGADDFADDYHPMADAPLLPLVYTEGPAQGQGSSQIEIPDEFEPELVGHSRDFEGNSESAPEELPVELPPDSWPPKTMGPAYDPLVPELEGEFDSFCRAIDRDGLSARGNDILKLMWGVTPGRSRAYQAARKRRDEFAKRIDYYRFEES